MEPFYRIAHSHLDAGLSIIPIKADGSKSPAVAWKPYQQERPTEAEVCRWFADGHGYGLGIIGGKVSGNLEILDFDLPCLYPDFANLCAEHGLGDVVKALPLVATPSGGHHLYLRCVTPVGGNVKLAMRLIDIPDDAERYMKGAKSFAKWDGKEFPVVKRDGQEKALTVGIETRGEGGYVVAPGSPAACHPQNKPYLLRRGDLTAIPVITAEQRDTLHTLAGAFNEYVDESKVRDCRTSQQTGNGLLPGQDYNQRGDVLAELEAHGYEVIGERGETVLLKRPGKTETGISATFGYGGSRCFYNFSTNDPYFDAETPYSPFAVFTYLHCGKDAYSEAARLLATQGYGTPLPSPGVSSHNSLSSPPAMQKNRTAPPLASPPPALHEAAYIGLAGEFVDTIEPHTEGDPVAILVQFLLAFGNVIGRNACAPVEASHHYTNEFAVLVGQSAKARKGTSMGWVRYVFEEVDKDWVDHRQYGGLSSGEGVIWAVRDPVEKKVPIKEKGKVTGYQTVIDDAGVEDKRLLVVEEEFARALIVMERDTNTLSSILRQCWDSGKLRVMTKTAYKATDAHISVIGHITRDELRRLMTDTAKVNGFANRFLWFYVQRSKMLPEGGCLPQDALNSFCARLRLAVEFGRKVRVLERDEEAREAWKDVYPELTREEAGLLGSVTSRADPHVLRLSCLYALLDQSEKVRREHLEAALAVWEYAEQSAEYIFGDALGDPVADAILQALRKEANGLTRNEISNLFGRHYKAERLAAALNLLLERGLAVSETVETGGRPAEVWKATVPDREAK